MTTSTNDYIVIFWNPTDRWQWTPTRCGERGEDCKVVQDRVASIAAAKPHIIYMVVLEQDYFQALRSGFGNR